MDLPENVFDLSVQKPRHEDGDKEGKVLYFHPKMGWYSALWVHTLYTGTTHWTYCPESPAVPPEDPKTLRQQAFEEWLETLDVAIQAPARSFAELAWNAAWTKCKGLS